MGYLYQFIGHLLLPFGSFLSPTTNIWKTKILYALISYFIIAFIIAKFFFVFLFAVFPLMGLISWSIAWMRKQRTATIGTVLGHTGIFIALAIFHNFFYFHNFYLPIKDPKYGYRANFVDPLAYQWYGVGRGDVVLLRGPYGLVSGVIVGEAGDSVLAGPNWIETLKHMDDTTKFNRYPAVYLHTSPDYSNPNDRYFQQGQKQFEKFAVGSGQYYIASNNPLDFKWGLYSIDQIQGRLVWGLSASGL